jgi:hypothetical protein
MMNNAALILKQLNATTLTGDAISEAELKRTDSHKIISKPKDLGRNQSLDSPVVYATSSLDKNSIKRPRGRTGYETFVQPSQTIPIESSQSPHAKGIPMPMKSSMIESMLQKVKKPKLSLVKKTTLELNNDTPQKHLNLRKTNSVLVVAQSTPSKSSNIEKR